MWEPPDLESIAEPLEESEEEVPVGSGAKVAKGKARATPKVPQEVHGEDPSLDSASSSSKPGISPSAFDTWTVLHRQTKPKMPWETAAFANPFQPKFKKPRFEVPQIGFREAISAPSASPAAGNMEHQRLRMSGLIKTEDQLRWEALRKIKVVVLLNPMASSIGETMATQAMTLRANLWHPSPTALQGRQREHW